MAPTYNARLRRPQRGDIVEANDRRYGEPQSTPSPKQTSLVIEVGGAIESVAIPGYRVTELSR